MSALEEVDGGFNLQSTDGKFQCSEFKKMQNNGVIRGKYECKATTSHPTTANGQSGTTSSTGSSSGSGSSASSSGAAVANMANIPIAGVAAAFYAVAQFL